MILSHQVCAADSGKRVVDILKGTVGMSSLLTKRIRLYGTMTVNGVPSRMIDPAQEGDCITVAYRDRESQEPETVCARGEIDILYSDRSIIVAVKPAGIVTHHTSNHQSGTLVDFFQELETHPIHRLDRETSGILLIARDPHSQYVLSGQQKNHCMEKEYLGINHGIFAPSGGFIDAPIARRPDTIMLRHVSPEGSPSLTEYATVEGFPRAGASLMRYSLKTGRTHQIRVHTLYAGHPIIGDGLYGASSLENAHYQRSARFDREIGRQALHAASLAFDHPITGERMRFESALPEDMRQLLSKLRQTELDRPIP